MNSETQKAFLFSVQYLLHKTLACDWSSCSCYGNIYRNASSEDLYAFLVWLNMHLCRNNVCNECLLPLQHLILRQVSDKSIMTLITLFFLLTWNHLSQSTIEQKLILVVKTVDSCRLTHFVGVRISLQ